MSYFIYYCRDCRSYKDLEVGLVGDTLNAIFGSSPRKTIRCDNCGGEARYVRCQS